MKYLFRIILLLFLTASFAWLWGNSANNTPSPRRVVQFSGMVLTSDSLAPIPFTNIWIQNTRRGTISDFNGFFTITLRERDTLHFTAVGYKDVFYVVPDTLSSNRYSTIQLMTRDTINLPETVIYPWPTREQFRYAFLNAEIPDDDLDRAMRNLERAEMRERFKQMPMDGYSNYRFAQQQYADRLYYAGQRPPMRIFDPFAWSQFIQAWRDGKFKRTD